MPATFIGIQRKGLVPPVRISTISGLEEFAVLRVNRTENCATDVIQVFHLINRLNTRRLVRSLRKSASSADAVNPQISQSNADKQSGSKNERSVTESNLSGWPFLWNGAGNGTALGICLWCQVPLAFDAMVFIFALLRPRIDCGCCDVVESCNRQSRDFLRRSSVP